MKTIPNITFDAKPEPVSVAKLLETCLATPPQQGFDFATIRARQRVQDVLDKVTDGGEIQLEDADFQTAKDAVAVTRWVRPDKHLLSFAELFGL